MCAETVAEARRWVRSDDVGARGMTDILAPLKLALAMLEGVQGERPDHHVEQHCLHQRPRAAQQSKCTVMLLLD